MHLDSSFAPAYNVPPYPQGFPYWCCAAKVSSCSSQVLCAAPLHFIWGLAITGIGDINPPFPSLKNTTPVLQIRDFQLVGQWAEGLKGILRPQLVQESCIFLLPRSTKNGENQCWFILYHVYTRYSHEK